MLVVRNLHYFSRGNYATHPAQQIFFDMANDKIYYLGSEELQNWIININSST